MYKAASRLDDQGNRTPTSTHSVLAVLRFESIGILSKLIPNSSLVRVWKPSLVYAANFFKYLNSTRHQFGPNVNEY